MAERENVMRVFWVRNRTVAKVDWAWHEDQAHAVLVSP